MSDPEPSGVRDAVLAAPNLFIVGAMKGGTTSAYRSLKDCPQVFAPDFKEPHHFSTDLHAHRHTLMRRTVHNFPAARFLESRRGYLKLYEGMPLDTRYAVDASTTYLYSTQAAENIFKFSPDAKIVILLRDPVARAWSEYQMNQRIGLEIHPFEEAIRREQRQLARGETFLFKRYVLAGLYGEQVARYLDLFPRENIFIDVIDRPADGFAGTLSRLASFLDLPADSLPVFHENQSRVATRRIVNGVLYYSGLKALISTIFPPGLRVLARVTFYKPPQSRIPSDATALLAPLFEASNRRLAALTGLNLDHWTQP